MKLLEALRQATDAAHQRLHVHPALSKLDKGDVSQPYLIDALKGFYEFYLPLETAYGQSRSPLLEKFPAGPVLERLRSDLALPEGEKFLPPSPIHMSEAECLAYLYLREGSTLGGQLISRNLEHVLGLVPGIGNKFFAGAGEKNGANWKKFKDELSYLEDCIDIDLASAHAAHYFGLLENILSYRKA